MTKSDTKEDLKTIDPIIEEEEREPIFKPDEVPYHSISFWDRISWGWVNKLINKAHEKEDFKYKVTDFGSLQQGFGSEVTTKEMGVAWEKYKTKPAANGWNVVKFYFEIFKYDFISICFFGFFQSFLGIVGTHTYQNLMEYLTDETLDNWHLGLVCVLIHVA